jgi:hypothetical protein
MGKVYIGFRLLGHLDETQESSVSKEGMRKLFEILGEGKFWWRLLSPELRKKVYDLWPVVQYEYWNRTGPKWSWFKGHAFREAYGVAFGEMYQESILCPFCGLEPRKCIHYLGPSWYENGLFEYISRKHFNLWLPAKRFKNENLICILEEE